MRRPVRRERPVCMHTMSPPKPATLTIPEASRALGISPSHGYGLAQAGKFPCRTLRLGRRIVVPAGEVARLLGQVVREASA